MKWKWDNTCIKDHYTLEENDMVMIKKSGNCWFTGFGTNVFEKERVWRWRIKNDKYPSGDKSGFVVGICESSA